MHSPRSFLLVALIAASGCVGVVGDRNDVAGTGASFAPAAATLHRLTRPQLGNAWIDLFGEPLALPGGLPADDRLHGFSSISAASSTISPIDAEKYEVATYHVLDQVWADPARREALIGCAPTAVESPCVKAFAGEFAARAWRRPVSGEEVATLIALGSSIAEQLGDAAQGVKFMLAAVLSSPHFLFRVEIGEAGPGGGERGQGGYRYTSWEMASRLSFLLLDAPPDEGLREAAASGELVRAEGVRAEAARLLEDPRARPALLGFFRDFMNIAALDGLDKPPEKFPQLSLTLGPSMRLEMERMFEDNVFEREGDLRDLLTTRETFLNQDLGRVYGVTGLSGAELVPVTLPDDGRRAGILTTPGFLALNAHKAQTSPARRGRFVRLHLLCQDIAPPPPGIDTSLPEPEPGNPVTLREQLSEHQSNPGCAGCHERMDPIGFAFERYDAIGAYREVDENGLALDTASEVDGVGVEGAVDVAELLASLPEVSACIARRFYEHAGAHLAGRGDAGSIEKLVADFVAGDYTFKELVLAVVVSDGFRRAQAPDVAPEAP